MPTHAAGAYLAAQAEKEAALKAGQEEGSRGGTRRGSRCTQFTCFTSAKVQILTQEQQRRHFRREAGGDRLLYLLY
jgi:hypothetical protein